MIAKHGMDYAQKGRRKTLQRKDLGKLSLDDLKLIFKILRLLCVYHSL